MHADTAEKEYLRKYIIAIFEKMYDDFLHQRWDVIQQRLKIDDETRNKIRQHITRFIPAPLSSEEGLADHGSALAEPDFIIKENSEGEVYVVLNDSHIPQVQLNPEVQREIKYIEEKKELPPCLTMSLAAYIAFYSSDLQELGERELIAKRPAGNTYAINDDRWVLEFYWAHKDDSVRELVHSVLSNEKMWDQDLSKIENLEDELVRGLTMIREEGALAAFKSCL
jgi:hypothetical protein